MSIEVHERELALARLEAIRDELGAIGTWLTMHDEDRAAILIETAWANLGASAHELELYYRRPTGVMNGGHGTRHPMHTPH